ncbi:MAG: PD-(D/E)XK nuclease family protein, partial [Polyangiaceae bacterium]|nr:PD-(D/E)XK nuclease family protein [Polyangiaceae bacterium]
MGAWNHRAYGTLADPVRQSDLNELASSYSCPKRFAFKKEERFSGVEIQRKRAWGASCVGTGVHETIKLYADPLGKGCARILAGELPSEAAVSVVVTEQIDKAAEGLPIEWKVSPATAITEAVRMVLGALRGLAERAAEVVLIEAPFLVEIEAGASGKAPYYLTGTIDLVYRPKDDPSALVLADWKTGQQRPSEIVLDHGYQLGIYAHALACGVFFAGTEHEIRLNQFPREMRIVHLRDFVPYAKAGSKTPTHRDELAHYRCT